MFTASDSLITSNAKSLLEAGQSAIASGETEFDLADVKVVDSAAVALLLAWQRAAQAKPAVLQFKNLPDNLRSLIELYGVGALLHCPSRVNADADIGHH